MYDTKDDEKEQIRIKYLNKEAIEELILSIDTNIAAGKVIFCVIKGCTTKDYPNGNALKDQKRFCDKYIDKSAPTLNKIKNFFQSQG